MYNLYGKIEFQKYDILVFTETYLLKDRSHIINANNQDIFDGNIPGFYCKHIFGSKRAEGRPFHGVSVYFNYKAGELLSFKLLKNFLILNFKHFSLVASYLNPKLKEDAIWNQLIESHTHVQHPENLILAGDFNSRFDIPSKKGEQLKDFAEFNNLVLANPLPLQKTFISKKGSSVIDLVFTGKGIKVNNFSVTDSHLRNHSVISFDFPVPQSSKGRLDNVKIFIDQQHLETLVLEKYRERLRENLNAKDIDGFYENVLKLIEEAKAHKNKTPRKSQPWFDKECYLFRQDLTFLRSTIDNFPTHRNYKTYRNEILEIFALARKHYRALCRNKKTDFISKQETKTLEEAEKTCYKLLKLNRNHAPRDNDIPMKTWELTFNKVFNELKCSHGDSLNLRTMLAHLPAAANINNILEAEVILALKGLKPKKAPGIDSLTNENLKAVCLLLPSEITDFFNLCLTNSSFPSSWKIANLKLLFKGKGDPTDVNNYRGISLSSSFYNLFDRILNTRMYASLIDTIPPNQYGFVRGKSTILAIKDLIKHINTSVYEKRKPMYALFLDVKKAFDSIDRKFIFRKLIDSEKFQVDELNMLAEMLDVNYLIINDGVTISEKIVQSNGVRQGGCLSPFLFIYAISNFNEAILEFEDVRAMLYADDIVLCSESLESIKAALNKVVQFLAVRNLKLNLSKCKIIKFRTNGKGRYKKEDVIQCEETNIEFVPEFCYLGVIIQASGNTFAKHIVKRVKAANFATSKLGAIHKSSLATALKLFNLAIAPVASYGIEAIWPYLDVNDLITLETAKSTFLKKTMRIALKSRSRNLYQLAETEFFVNELMCKYSLPENDVSKQFNAQMNTKIREIEPMFYDTPAMQNPSWKQINCEDRHMFTRHAVHGFHYLLCTDKSFHHSAKEECECEKCGEKIGLYHLLECPAKSLTLAQAAKMKKQKK